MQTPRTTSVSIAVVAAGLALFGTLTSANAGPGAPGATMKPGAGKHMGGGNMAAALNLTPAQQTQLKSIQADAVKQRTAIMENTKLTPEQKKAQMRPLMMGMMKKMEAVLTPAQKATLQKNMAEQRSKMKGMMGKGGAPAAPAAKP